MCASVGLKTKLTLGEIRPAILGHGVEQILDVITRNHGQAATQQEAENLLCVLC